MSDNPKNLKNKKGEGEKPSVVQGESNLMGMPPRVRGGPVVWTTSALFFNVGFSVGCPDQSGHADTVIHSFPANIY